MKIILEHFSIAFILLRIAVSVVKSTNRPPTNTFSSQEPIFVLKRLNDDVRYRLNNVSNIFHSFISKRRLVNRDFVFEEKKREDAYQKLPANTSPYAVLLAISYDGANDDELMVCSGSLLTDRWVLTAAHCLTKDDKKPKEVVLYAGGYSLVEVVNKQLAKGSQIDSNVEFYVHPEYNKTAHSYDVAVIRSFRRFYLSETINTIQLSERPWGSEVYKECSLTGFGMVNYGELHEDDTMRKTQTMKIEYPCKCKTALGVILDSTKGDTYLCGVAVKDFGLCVGDSGSSLVCDGEIMGIAMELVVLKNVETCELPDEFVPLKCDDVGTVSIFTSSYFVASWVNSVLSTPELTETSGHIETPLGDIKEGDPNICESIHVKKLALFIVLSKIININI